MFHLPLVVAGFISCLVTEAAALVILTFETVEPAGCNTAKYIDNYTSTAISTKLIGKQHSLEATVKF